MDNLSEEILKFCEKPRYLWEIEEKFESSENFITELMIENRLLPFKSKPTDAWSKYETNKK